MSYGANKLFLPYLAMVKNRRIRSCDLDLWPWNSSGFVWLSRYMFLQNFIKLSAAVHELSWSQRKNSDEHNTVRRYRANSNKKYTHTCLTVHWHKHALLMYW